MLEWELLILLFLAAVTNVFLPVAITFTLNAYMHWGHVLGFIRAKRARKVLQVSREDFEELIYGDDENPDWPTLIENASDLYWQLAATDNRMKLLICPVCIGSRISIITCFLLGIAISFGFDFSAAEMVYLIGGALFCCLPFSVWIIGTKI